MLEERFSQEEALAEEISVQPISIKEIGLLFAGGNFFFQKMKDGKTIRWSGKDTFNLISSKGTIKVISLESEYGAEGELQFSLDGEGEYLLFTQGNTSLRLKLSRKGIVDSTGVRYIFYLPDREG